LCQFHCRLPWLITVPKSELRVTETQTARQRQIGTARTLAAAE
jgi:hypothetical protein